jgi:hypothetical protein
VALGHVDFSVSLKTLLEIDTALTQYPQRRQRDRLRRHNFHILPHACPTYGNDKDGYREEN